MNLMGSFRECYGNSHVSWRSAYISVSELVANVVPSSGPSTLLSLEVVVGNGKDHGVPNWDPEDSNRLANRLQDNRFAD